MRSSVAPWDITGQVSSGRKCSEQQVKRNPPTATVWFQPLSRRHEAPEEVDHFFCPPAAELCLSRRRTKSTNGLVANGRARYFGRLRGGASGRLCVRTEEMKTRRS